MRNLLIDVGSSNIKYALAENYEIKEFDSFSFPNAKCIDEYKYEVDPQEILKIIYNIIDLYCNLDSIFIDTQMHGYILLDKYNEELTNYISWKDTRAKKYNINFDVSLTSGTKLKANLPRASIEAIKIENPSIYSKIAKFMSLGSYVAYKLTNINKANITDLAASGFYDIFTLKGIDTFFELPLISKNIELVGYYKNIKVYTPLGDQQASIYSISSFDGYILNIGTASQMLEVSNTFKIGEYETRPMLNNKFLLSISSLPGGKEIFKEENEEKLYKIYKETINKLPRKDKIIITGGIVEVKKELFKKVFNRLNINVYFNKGLDSLNGLNLISKEVKNMERKVGTMISEIAFTNMPLIIKASNMDYFLLDYEHGGFDYSSMFNIISMANAINLECIVRLPNNQRKDIIKIMDIGACGVLLPMTNTKDDIKQVVKYAKYRPLGERGVSTMRAHTMYNPSEILLYQNEANAKTKVFAQIETKQGVLNFIDIINEEGVDGFMLGPNDLSDDYNCLNEKNPKVIIDIIEKLGKLAHDNNKIAGIITNNECYINTAKKANYEYFSCGSELNALKNSFKEITNKIKGEK